MHAWFRARRALQLALTTNAIRPWSGHRISVPAFVAGWLTSELAPQLLALTAADTTAHLVRHRRASDPTGLAMAAASAGGLAALIESARRARGVVDTALTDALGPDHRGPTGDRAADDVATPWGRLAFPFRMDTRGVRRDRDIAYDRGGRRFLLDVYRPNEPGTGRPVLLQVHGGAWMTGSKNEQGVPLMLHMARRGWTCVAINYPLSPRSRWPEHIVAAKRALAWIRDRIADYGGDPSFVATTGGSAGGHLASLLALTPNDPAFQPGFTGSDTSVQACVPHYGVYDFAATSGSRASAARMRGLLARFVMGPEPTHADYVAASPLDRITDAAPPFFVIHGDRDSLVPVGEARRFVGALRAVSPQPVAYAEIPGAQHAFDIFPSIRSAHVVAGVERFLEWTRDRHRNGAGAPVSGEAGPATAAPPR
ncbi:alpha/beta hydrolase [Prauserella alba]|uniref:Alpha/beta hydrolase n=1 Tax=Prauserella alba TaxID=176898 RepID=A0ABP4GC00_9PSEU|nr:alpha/beta hydrolase [Prauserella alba]MCP2179897.1 Acetyl esterase/lipase [Prauserella alba]